MKKKTTYTALICIFVLSLASGCFIMSRSCTSICQDPKIMTQLNPDRVDPEFVLQGNYYLLPCSLKEFLNDGWRIEKIWGRKKGQIISSISDENIELTRGECVDIKLRWKKSSDSLSIQVANLSQESCIMTEGQVIHVEMEDTWKLIDPLNRNGSNRFVVRSGINLRTSGQKVKEMLKSTPGFQIKKEEFLWSTVEYAEIRQDNVVIYSILLRQGTETNLISINSSIKSQFHYKQTDQ